MRFYNMEGSGIEINCYNFSCILGGSNIGLTPVKLKDGTEEWLTFFDDPGGGILSLISQVRP